VSEAYPQLAIGSRGQWRAWLAAYHDRAAGVWVVTFKKGSGRPYVAYDEVVECLVVAGRSRPAGPCSKSRRRHSLG
jgi:hypothetical protein